jgi:hypothetical protein
MEELPSQKKKLGFQVLTAVVMKTSVFWDITPYSSSKVSRRFERTFRLHLEQEASMKAGDKQSSFSPYSSTLRMKAIFSLPEGGTVLVLASVLSFK